MQSSPDLLAEASASALGVIGEYGEAQSALFRILIDEFGYGAHGKKHAVLYRATMRSFGLDDAYNGYWPWFDTVSLELHNAIHWLFQNPRNVFRQVGFLLHAETAYQRSTQAHYRYLREFHPDADARYFGEHAHIDLHHTRMMIDDVVTPLVARFGAEAGAEIIAGADLTKACFARAGAHLLAISQAFAVAPSATWGVTGEPRARIGRPVTPRSSPAPGLFWSRGAGGAPGRAGFRGLPFRGDRTGGGMTDDGPMGEEASVWIGHDLPPIRRDGVDYFLLSAQGELYLVPNRCPHRGGPLKFRAAERNRRAGLPDARGNAFFDPEPDRQSGDPSLDSIMTGLPLSLVVERGAFKPANAVTLSRGLLIAPIFALLWWGQPSAALGLYVLAALTSTSWTAGWRGGSSRPRRLGRSSMRWSTTCSRSRSSVSWRSPIRA